MNSLDFITDVPATIPDLMIIYGPEGVGKSTFGSKAPKPICLDLENGTKRIQGLLRYSRAKTFGDALQFINDLHDNTDPKKDFSHLIIDTVSELERMIWTQLCLDEGVSNIEQVGGGFNKGYVIALKYWENLKRALIKLQDKKNMGIILIGHSETKSFADPITMGSYDRHSLKLDKKAAGLLREWVDFVGFANFVTHTKGKENALKQKAFGDGTVKLYTQRRPAYDAKNRLGLPLMIDFEYSVYSEAANSTPAAKAQTIRENIDEMLKDSVDEELKAKAKEIVAKAKDNTTDLMLIQERVRARVNKKEADNGTAK